MSDELPEGMADFLARTYPSNARVIELARTKPRYREKFARQMREGSDRSPRPETPRPSLARQARNFTRSVVRHVAAGMPKADEATKAARLAVCRECDQCQEGRCGACGCWLAVKAAMALETCPLGKWPQ